MLPESCLCRVEETNVEICFTGCSGYVANLLTIFLKSFCDVIRLNAFNGNSSSPQQTLWCEHLQKHQAIHCRCSAIVQTPSLCWFYMKACFVALQTQTWERCILVEAGTWRWIGGQNPLSGKTCKGGSYPSGVQKCPTCRFHVEYVGIMSASHANMWFTWRVEIPLQTPTWFKDAKRACNSWALSLLWTFW